MKELSFLTQDSLVQVSSSNCGEVNERLVVSRLNDIKKQVNFGMAYSHKVHYVNIPISFDIETSSFNEGIAKKAIMYIWTCNVNGTTFIGRTWNQFTKLIELISETFELNKFNKRCLIYVHNLEYEFQFMRKWFKWYDIFADSKRQPLYAVTTTGVEFRCSYRLSGYNLAKLGSELKTYKTEKMVGDLDYSLLRHSESYLSPKELRYCTQDTKVVVCYIQEEIERNGDIAHIPYTNTGYVRRYCQNECLHLRSTNDEVSRLKGLKYRDVMMSLTLTYEQYEMCKRGFQGGFTHANVNHVNKTLHNVGSFDFTSSYPFTMMAQYFPMSSPREVEIRDLQDLNFYLANYCCLFDVQFINIRPITTNENPISSSRCTFLKGEHINNGRVINAEILETTITELDFDIYRNFYEWDGIRVGKFLTFFKGYLPTPFVKSLVSLYKDKTELKGVEGKEVEYLRSKGMLNSAYGMCVTDIIRDELLYDQDAPSEWIESSDTGFSQLNRYNKNPSRFLYYPWGVWVTAHARHNLFKGIMEFGDDYVYSDTDSIKALNIDKHMDFIKNYNLHVREQLQKASEWHGIPMEDFEPKTIKGEPKLIGVWDFEGMYDKFKTLGAKRYLVQQDDKIEFTVAGVNKKAIKEYMLETYGLEGVFDAFTRSLDIPKGRTGKLTHTYIDTEWEGNIVDYLGQPFHYLEKSAIHLEPAPFKISLLDAFWDYINGVQQKEK